MNNPRPLVLLHVQCTLASKARSGLERVVTELAKGLPRVADVDFVKWDYTDGQLRYLNSADLGRLFSQASLPAGVSPNPRAHRVNYRFGDTLPQARAVWLLFPEIAYHYEHGVEVMTRICAMCREYGVNTAGIFYDAIPITNISYRDLKRRHSRYVAQLARLDRIYAISHHSKRELEAVYRQYVPDEIQFSDLCKRIVAIPLGEGSGHRATTSMPGGVARAKILLLGTVEPRKQQVVVLKILKMLPPAVMAGLEVHILGSLHPDVAQEFNALVASLDGAHYHGYASQSTVDRLFDEALFTIFASTDEGFGLPITESLARGVPCLTADFGAMAEIARGGGCLAVNVRNRGQLAAAIATLITDRQLLARLRNEIERRKRRTWSDYAEQLVDDMSSADADERAAGARLRDDIVEALRQSLTQETPSSIRPLSLQPGLARTRLTIDAGAPGTEAFNWPALVATDALSEVRVVTGEWAPSRRNKLRQSATATAWAFQSADTLDTFIAECGRSQCAGMLPPICVVDNDPGRLAGRTADELVRYLRGTWRRQRIAEREKLLIGMSERWPDARAEGAPLLDIVISTFNRAPFVRENVRWLLKLLDRYSEDVRLTVVDNASSDDTMDRLAEFRGARRLTILANPVNVGMLGNLRVCSSLTGARHVWVTGDDDFITPEGLGEVLDVIRAHPETPLLAVNFGVYQRTTLGPRDTAESLMSERAPMSANPSPSGFYSVARIAEEHDNLFTAIYPLVMRSDLLSACFNHPFDGAPFFDLVESVPTTRMLLETYADSQAYWCSKLGIVGNLSNSWSVHRPRWHAVLMPRVFRLAQEAGVDAIKLQQWATLHFDLFREAERLAGANGADLNIAEHELEPSHLVFRRKLSPVTGLEPA